MSLVWDGGQCQGGGTCRQRTHAVTVWWTRSREEVVSGESAMVALSKSGAEEGASGQVQSGEASEEDHGSLYIIGGS